jgi:hypothetical protein
MIMRTILLAAVLSTLAVPAFAESPWTATPAQASNQTGFVGDSVIWNCGASGCQSQSDVSTANDLWECQGVAREVGELTSFSGRHGAFDATHLGECNQAARKSKS